MNYLSFTNCLGLNKVDRLYHLSAGDINPKTGKAYAINPGSGNWDDNYFAQNFGGASQGGGGGSSDLSGYFKQQQDQLAANKAATDARFAANKQELGDFNTRFQSAIPGIINAPAEKYGVGTLLGATNQAATELHRTRENVGGMGAGGYASQGQVNSAVNTNLLPKYNAASENLLRAASVAQGESQMMFAPYQAEAGMLNDRLSREATGYSQQQENELSTLITQMNAGVNLTTAQMTQATQLAQLEQAKYQFEKELQVSNEATEIVEAGGRKLLVNSRTGETVRDLGSSSSGTGTGTGSFGTYLNPAQTTSTASAPQGGNKYESVNFAQTPISLLGGGNWTGNTTNLSSQPQQKKQTAYDKFSTYKF